MLRFVRRSAGNLHSSSFRYLSNVSFCSSVQKHSKLQGNDVVNPNLVFRKPTPTYEKFSSFISTGDVEKADELFRAFINDKRSYLTTSIFNTLIRAWLQKGNVEKAFEVFNVLLNSNLPPNAKTISHLMNACLTNSNQLHRLQSLSKAMDTYSISPQSLLHCSTSPIGIGDENNNSLDPKIFVKLSPSQGYSFNAYSRQIRLESSKIDERVLYYSNLEKLSRGKRMTKNIVSSDSEELILRWFIPLKDAISVELKYLHTEIKQTEDLEEKERMKELSDGLRIISKDKLALLCIYETLSHLISSPSGAKFTQIVLSVGSAIQSHNNIQKIYSIIKGIPHNELQNHPKYIKARKEISDSKIWTSSFTAKLGGWIVNLLINSTAIRNGRTRAFKHSYISENGKRFGIIVAHPEVISSFKPNDILMDNITSKYQPMVVPPLPWRGIRDGAFYLSSPSFVRSPTQSQELRMNNNNLSPMYNLVNILSSVPWRINPIMYKTIAEAYNSNNQYNLPDIPMKDCQNDTSKSHQTSRYQFQRIFQTLERFHQEPKIYFPHNIDFRGRCYPVPSYLNHMGSDLCRGVLQFAEGKPLGERGLSWMKIHLANLYGENKVFS